MNPQKKALYFLFWLCLFLAIWFIYIKTRNYIYLSFFTFPLALVPVFQRLWREEKTGKSISPHVYYVDQRNIVNLTIVSSNNDNITQDLLSEMYTNIRHLLDKHDYSKAIEKCDEFIKKQNAKHHPKYAAVIANKGVALYAIGDKLGAYELFKESCSMDNTNAAIHVNLAVYYFESNEYGLAKRELDFADTFRKNYVESLNLRSVILDGEGKTEEAISIAEQVISINKTYWDGYANLALYEMRRDNYPKAEQYILKALDNKNQDGNYHGIYGTICLRKSFNPLKMKEINSDGMMFFDDSSKDAINKSDIVDAIKEYELAVKYGVKQKDVLFTNLSMAYCHNGDYDKAITVIGDLEKEYGVLKSSLLFTKAQCLFKQGRKDDALMCYQAYENNIPGNASVLNNMGNIYMERKEYLDAIKCLNKAIGIRPDDPILYSNLGKIHFLNGTINAAIKNLQLAKNKGLKDDKLALGLAQACTKNQMYGNAVNYYKEYLAEHKNDIDITKKLCNTQMKAKYYRDAKATAESLLKMNINDSDRKVVEKIIVDCTPFL